MRIHVVVLLVAGLTLAACDDGSDTPEGLPSVSSSATPTESAPSPLPSLTTAPTPVRPTTWPTTARERAETPTGSLAVLRSIRTARHDGYDRLVLEFDQPLNGYRVAYVSQVREDPSDRPVSLEGSAFLEVVLHHATTDNEFAISAPAERRSYPGPETVAPRLPTLRQVKVTGDFEAVLSFGIGLSHRAGFDVHVLDSPARLVIDVAH